MVKNDYKVSIQLIFQSYISLIITDMPIVPLSVKVFLTNKTNFQSYISLIITLIITLFNISSCC
jgi:hypothetical protein